MLLLHQGPRERGTVLELDQRTGTIKCWYNGEGGFGYILPDDGDEELFVHHTAIAAHAKVKPLQEEGVRVSYEVARRKMGGMWAKDVCKAN
jgi:cold shock protein